MRWNFLSSVPVSAGTLRGILIEREMELSIKCLSFCRNFEMDLDRTWDGTLHQVSQFSAGTLRWTLIELEMELSIKCLSFCRNFEMDLDGTWDGTFYQVSQFLQELWMDLDRTWDGTFYQVSQCSAGTLRWTLIELEMELSIKCPSFCRNFEMDLDRTWDGTFYQVSQFLHELWDGSW